MRSWSRRWLSMALLLAVIVAGLSYGTPSSSAQITQGECPEGSILSDNGVTCELDVGQNSNPSDPCPEGQRLDAAGLLCEAIPADPNTPCPPGQELDDIGLFCVEIIESVGNCPPGQQPNELNTACIPIPDGGSGTSGTGATCDVGFSLGADGVTCVADGPSCASDEVLGDDGECVKSFQCPPGQILRSDLLSCSTRDCPDDEVLSIDGKRCVAQAETCPDGSPRPVGGSCLVVETVEAPDGTLDVVVRCNENDVFCQAQVNACAQDRATASAGDDVEQDCEDPRASCDDDDAECLVANERLIECAVRDEVPSDDALARFDPCEDLCPRLHRLDASGECIEFLDPTHPCVSFGQLPPGVTTNAQLASYAYLAGTGQCVTRQEFLQRLGNFEAAAGAEAEALSLLRETTSNYLSVEEELAALDRQLVDAQARVEDFTAAAAAADVERQRNDKRLIETRKQLRQEVELLKIEAVEAFVTGGSDQALLAALLGADAFNEVGTILVYSEVLLDDQIDNIERVRGLEAQTAQLALDLDRAAAEVQASLRSAVEASDELEQLVAEAEQLREEQIERRNREAELVAELREDKAEFAQELGIFEQASREIGDILAESEFIVTAFESGDNSIMANPVIPATVISGFGPRLHPILGYVRQHDGLDFDANFGEPIYASQTGIVEISSSFGGYGETVVLNHGGLHTLYAHMSVRGVEAGDEVERGDVIGFIGSTGLSTGPHLHFEVWVEGRTAVDPLLYLVELNQN